MAEWWVWLLGVCGVFLALLIPTVHSLRSSPGTPVVVDLVSYPVKSAGGVSFAGLGGVCFDARGLALDRHWMAVNKNTGKFICQRQFPVVATIEVDASVVVVASVEHRLTFELSSFQPTHSAFCARARASACTYPPTHPHAADFRAGPRRALVHGHRNGRKGEGMFILKPYPFSCGCACACACA